MNTRMQPSFPTRSPNERLGRFFTLKPPDFLGQYPKGKKEQKMKDLAQYRDPRGTVFIDPFADEAEEAAWNANATALSQRTTGK